MISGLSKSMSKFKIGIAVFIAMIFFSIEPVFASVEPIPKMCTTMIYGMLELSNPPSTAELSRVRNYTACISGHPGYIAVQQSMSQKKMGEMSALIEYKDGTTYAFNVRLVDKAKCVNLGKTPRIKRIKYGLLALGCVFPRYKIRNGEYGDDYDIQGLYAVSVINKNKELNDTYLRYFTINIGTLITSRPDKSW